MYGHVMKKHSKLFQLPDGIFYNIHIYVSNVYPIPVISHLQTYSFWMSGVDPWLAGLLQMALGMFPRSDYDQFERDTWRFPALPAP